MILYILNSINYVNSKYQTKKENPMSNSQQNGNKFRLPRRSDKDYKISKLLI